MCILIKSFLSFPHKGRLPTLSVDKRLFYATNDEQCKSKGSSLCLARRNKGYDQIIDIKVPDCYFCLHISISTFIAQS